MSADGLSDATIRDVLTATRRIAVVAASALPWRPSYGVLGFPIAQGYDVTPVNPGLSGHAIHGRCVATRLAEAAPIEMVDVFRNSTHAGTGVDEAIALEARIVWMQLGVIDEAAAVRARAAGIIVVMDRCPAIEWRRLGLRDGELVTAKLTEGGRE
ncbi:MAG: CoA-binding protein [Pseudomonadota bacterium]|nr:CoA-binding protein [Pseudomonadota bacterium]